MYRWRPIDPDYYFDLAAELLDDQSRAREVVERSRQLLAGPLPDTFLGRSRFDPLLEPPKK
jgi:hypothetical protein